MKNKKKLIIFVLIVAIVVFIALFFIYYYRESSLLSSEDKKWISENGTKVIDVEVLNDVAVYGMDGKGIIFDYLNYVTDETNLQFNKIPYLKSENVNKDDYKFEFINGSTALSTNQLLIFEDNYVAISKDKDLKINRITDFSDYTIGVLTNEESNISYYLKSADNIKYNTYNNMKNLFDALDDDEVKLIIAPNMMSLEHTIGNDSYYFNYFFTDITKKLVLTLEEKNQALNNILKVS